METIHKLETTVAKWYKSMPHLPKGGRDWIAQNVWWIVLIGVILGALGVVALFSTLLLGTVFLGGLLGGYGLVAGAAATIAVFVSLAFSIATIVIDGLAIQPLKRMQKRGWELLFITALISVVSLLAHLILNHSFSGFVSGVIGLLIGGYLLFEIRDHFPQKHAE